MKETWVWFDKPETVKRTTPSVGMTLCAKMVYAREILFADELPPTLQSYEVLTRPSWTDMDCVQFEMADASVACENVWLFTVKRIVDQVGKVEIGCSPPVWACREELGNQPRLSQPDQPSSLTKLVPAVSALQEAQGQSRRFRNSRSEENALLVIEAGDDGGSLPRREKGPSLSANVLAGRHRLPVTEALCAPESPESQPAGFEKPSRFHDHSPAGKRCPM